MRYFVFYIQGDVQTTENGMEDYATREEALAFARGLIKEDRTTSYWIVYGVLAEVASYGSVLQTE